MSDVNANDPTVIEAKFQSVTDQTGTLDTSGTAGAAHNDISQMSPVFEHARHQELGAALRALDPDDDEVPGSLVVVDEKVAPGHAQGVARARIESALDDAKDAVDTRYGTEDWFDKNTGSDAPRGEAVASLDAEDGGGAIAAPVNTDVTGTLDTSGTAGVGHPSADDISVTAQVARAKAGKEPKATASQNQESATTKAEKKAAPKKSAPRKKAAAKKKAAAPRKAAAKKEAAKSES